MKVDNKLDRTFNGPAIVAGFVIAASAILGIIMGHLIFGVATLIGSSFVIFTFSGVEIDTMNRQVKQYQKLFGIIRTGKWKSLDSFSGVTLIYMRKAQTMASMSNRRTSIVERDFRIFLVNKAKKPAFAIKKCKTMEQAQNSIDEFSLWLKLPVFSLKR